MAMDLSVHNTNRDNNNDISVVDLSLTKNLTDDKDQDIKHTYDKDDAIIKTDSDKLRALLPQLDIAALNILCLARLQVNLNPRFRINKPTLFLCVLNIGSNYLSYILLLKYDYLSSLIDQITSNFLSCLLC